MSTPAAGRLQAYGEADGDSISWCCEKTKCPGAAPRALSGRFGAILPPTVFQEPPPQLVLGVLERRRATGKCWGDHGAGLVESDTPHEAKQCQCAHRRPRWRSPKDAVVVWEQVIPFPRPVMALDCSRQTSSLGQARSSGEDVLGGFSGWFGHVRCTLGMEELIIPSVN